MDSFSLFKYEKKKINKLNQIQLINFTLNNKK